LALFVVWLVPSVGMAADRALSSYLEFRIYTAKDGQRDPFLNYFEEQYLESQEAEGMRIWGQFRDLDNANHFVWMRGYRTMEERASSLMGFYMGAHWKETSPRVGEMLAKADHVHFLEPVTPADALDDRFGRSADGHQVGVIVVQLFPVEQQPAGAFRDVRARARPAFAALPSRRLIRCGGILRRCEPSKPRGEPPAPDRNGRHVVLSARPPAH